MTRVFINYAKEDVDGAKRLVNDLRKIDGIEPWFDEEQLLPGMDWEDEIVRAIKTSQFVVLLLSKKGIEKVGFIQVEFRKILKYLEYRPPDEIFIIPARIERCETKYEILNKLQYVDLFPNWDLGVTKIEYAIKGKINSQISSALKNKPNELVATDDVVSKWKLKYGMQVLAVDPITVIDYMKERYSKHSNYIEEIHAIDIILQMIGEAKPLDTLVYLHRLSEIGQNIDVIDLNNSAYAFGIVLENAKKMPKFIQMLVLRNASDLLTRSVRYNLGNSYSQSLLLTEVTKHYMATKKFEEYEFDLEIVQNLVNYIKYDLHLAEIIIYYALRNQEYHLLVSLIPLFQKTFPQIPGIYIGSGVINHKYIGRIFLNKLEHDHKPDHAHLILLRISEYLLWSENYFDKEKGKELRVIVSELNPFMNRVCNILKNLTQEESIEFFIKLETLNETPPHFINQNLDWKLLLKSFHHICYLSRRETDFIKINDEGINNYRKFIQN